VFLTDSGSIFLANQAQALYQALGIPKLRPSVFARLRTCVIAFAVQLFLRLLAIEQLQVRCSSVGESRVSNDPLGHAELGEVYRPYTSKPPPHRLSTLWHAKGWHRSSCQMASVSRTTEFRSWDRCQEASLGVNLQV
jgi:hypothetical protein